MRSIRCRIQHSVKLAGVVDAQCIDGKPNGVVGRVVELADTMDLGSIGESRAGSSPVAPTKFGVCSFAACCGGV